MKRVLKWVLVSLNCLLILFLLLFSSILLCFSFSNPAQFGGYKALLVEETTDNAASLYILQTDFSALTDGAQILLYTESQTPIPATVSLVEGVPCIPDTDEAAVPVAQDSFGGIIVFQSMTLGSLLQWISAPGNLFFSYLLIGGGFILFALIMLGLYLLSTRRIAVLEEADETDDSISVPTDADSSSDAEEMDLPIYEAFFPSDQTSSSTAETASAADTSAPLKEDVIIYSLPVAPIPPTPQAEPPSETDSPSEDAPSPSATENTMPPKTSSELSAELILDDILKSFQDELLK